MKNCEMKAMMLIKNNGNAMQIVVKRSKLVFFILFILLLFACTGPRIALYNETAYSNAVSLKVESLALMDKATDSISAHVQEISTLETNIEKAYQYVRWLPRNELTVKQWEILKDSNRDLLGGFLKKWENEKVLHVVFIKEKEKQISDAFDEILKLETGKNKPKDK
jgi:hypothetical protein